MCRICVTDMVTNGVQKCISCVANPTTSQLNSNKAIPQVIYKMEILAVWDSETPEQIELQFVTID